MARPRPETVAFNEGFGSGLRRPLNQSVANGASSRNGRAAAASARLGRILSSAEASTSSGTCPFRRFLTVPERRRLNHAKLSPNEDNPISKHIIPGTTPSGNCPKTPFIIPSLKSGSTAIRHADVPILRAIFPGLHPAPIAPDRESMTPAHTTTS